MSNTVYEPQEDSYLLLEAVKKYAYGKVLDMGCGTGIQGKTAIKNKKVISVAFADINPEAIEYVKKSSMTSEYVVSDLFTKIADKFDTIIFNPPYLPEDEQDKEKVITTGGKYGYEVIERFLKQAGKHLNSEGVILIIFSSLTDKKQVDKIIKEHNYEKNLLEKKHFFMETLYVYKINLRRENLIKGHRGIVKIDQGYAIKSALTSAYNPKEEAKFLKILNKHNIGPKLMKSDNKSITMERIVGERIIEYITHAGKNDIIGVLMKILLQLETMDALGINKYELTHPHKHIIIRNKEPVMIDFERCRYTENPKNITQFIQFITSTKIIQLMERKGIKIYVEKLRKIAENYKSGQKTVIADKIMACVKES